uniref:Uncharacterized protein n=1 Tax=Haptolina brevifila TaxID=156173 RepID=A0A7S2H6B9_9EUKA
MNGNAALAMVNGIDPWQVNTSPECAPRAFPTESYMRVYIRKLVRNSIDSGEGEEALAWEAGCQDQRATHRCPTRDTPARVEICDDTDREAVQSLAQSSARSITTIK